MNSFNYQSEAEVLHGIGFSVLPVKGKETLLPKGYRDKMQLGLNAPMPPSDWHVKNVGEPDGVAVLCGKFSGNLLCLDFDLKNGDGEDFFGEYCMLIGGGNILSRMVPTRTPSGGRHLWFRFEGKDRKSEKLARNPEKKDLIETRGTGGYAVVPPSAGYTWIAEKWEKMGVLTEEETDYVLGMARCMDQFVPDAKEVPVWEPKGNVITPDSPLSRYDASTSGREFLEERGFRLIREHTSQAHFNRPDAKNRNGVDATWYKDKNHIRIWSTSTGLVQETERNYRPYQLLVFSEYNGDFSKAASDIARKFEMPRIMKMEVRPEPAQKPLSIKEADEQDKVRAVLKEAPKLSKKHEPFVGGPEIIQKVAVRRLEGWIGEKLRKEVSLTDLLLEEAVEKHIELDPQFVKEFVQKYYEKNADDFGEDNIKMPFLKAERFLKKHFIIRRNTVLLSTSILNRKTGEDSGLNENSIWNTMSRAGIKVSQAQVRAMMNDPQYYELYDPFVEYFKGLRKGKAGSIQALADYVTVAPEVRPFWNTMFRKALIRTVAGAVGNYPNRECIVLCSPQQNIGKTWFVRNLSPWGSLKYFSDEVIIQNKDQMFRICQNMIYLIDEIGQRAINEKMSDFLKMLISKQSVNERRLWENETTNMARKVTFWGTSNLPYLYPGENTRWITIPIYGINHDYNNHVTKVQEIDIDDVYAEAYEAYMSGGPFELTQEERKIQEEINREWIIGNEATGLVDTYVEGSEESPWMSPEEILGLLVASAPNIVRRVNANNLTEALKSRKVPHTYARNVHGQRVHMFKCKVNLNPRWDGEQLPS
jgi:predicted P-loop ATPase